MLDSLYWYRRSASYHMVCSNVLQAIKTLQATQSVTQTNCTGYNHAHAKKPCRGPRVSEVGEWWDFSKCNKSAVINPWSASWGVIRGPCPPKYVTVPPPLSHSQAFLQRFVKIFKCISLNIKSSLVNDLKNNKKKTYLKNLICFMCGDVCSLVRCLTFELVLFVTISSRQTAVSGHYDTMDTITLQW